MAAISDFNSAVCSRVPTFQEGIMLAQVWHVTIISSHLSYSNYHVFEFLSGNSKLAKISYLKEKLFISKESNGKTIFSIHGLSENIQIHFRASQLQQTKFTV